jgi:hypothetical protein
MPWIGSFFLAFTFSTKFRQYRRPDPAFLLLPMSSTFCTNVPLFQGHVSLLSLAYQIELFHLLKFLGQSPRVFTSLSNYTRLKNSMKVLIFETDSLLSVIAGKILFSATCSICPLSRADPLSSSPHPKR